MFILPYIRFILKSFTLNNKVISRARGVCARSSLFFMCVQLSRSAVAQL